MKKTSLIVALLAMLLPIAQTLASSDWYAQLDLKVATTSTGSGKVYVSTSDPGSSPSWGSFPASSGSKHFEGGSGDKSHACLFYIGAQADFGKRFDGWFTAEDGSGTAKYTVSSTTHTITSKSSSSNNPQTETLYAKFVDNPDSYTLTLNKPEGLANYTVTAPSGFPTDLSQGGGGDGL